MICLKMYRQSHGKCIQFRHLSCYCYSKDNNLLKRKNGSASFQAQNRDFSLQESAAAVARTQSGIFRSISESTPVEYFQNFLLTVHDTTGLPWWASIICSTVLVRSCITLPLAVYQNYILAKVQNLNKEMPAIAEELRKEVSMAVRLYKWDERTAKIEYKRSLKKQWNNLIVRDNCHPFKASFLIWAQIPMWVCLSVSLRNLVYMLPNGGLDAQLTLTELTLGGFGWIPNLVEVDASYILPVTLGVLNLSIIEIQNLSKTGTPTKIQRYATNFFRGLSVLMVPISACVPSCLVLYWTTSSAYGLVQNLLLMSPKVKRICRIPQTTNEMDRPYLHVFTRFKHKLNEVPGLK